MNLFKLLSSASCFLLLLINLSAFPQTIPKNDSVKLYDDQFKKELQKPWKKITLQKTNDKHAKSKEGTLLKLQDKSGYMEGILPKEMIEDYDQKFAEQLRSGDWRKVDFSKSASFKITDKPDKQPFILKEDSNEDMLASKNLLSLKNPPANKLTINKSYQQYFNSSIDNVGFYGWQFPIFYDDKMEEYELDSKANLGDFWASLADSKWDVFLEQVESYATKMNFKIGDWAYALLIHKIGSQIFFSDVNANTVFTCFMLNHSGIYCKMIEDDEKQYYLLLPTHDEILNTLYEKDKFHYYYHDFSKNSYHRPPTYLENKEISTPELAFTPPNIRMKPIYSFARTLPRFLDNHTTNTSKILNFNINTYSFVPFYSNISFMNEEVEVKINTNRINYYNDIPATSLNVYFEASCFIVKNKKLLHEVARILSGIDVYDEKINVLLDFISSKEAFPYKADTKSLFAEETLAESQSDCEDRAVLFAALAHELLDIKVLGIEYTNPSDHVIVAIPHKADVPLNNLDFIDYKGETYILCDPTAYGAAYGKVAERRKNQSYNVIDFEARCID
ncbi:MAG: hypothetical protein AB8B69_21725 [Chitinophagales bacterium]